MTREQFISQVKSCQKSLRRFLVALCCGDSQLADDIAQDSFIKAYMACDSLTDQTKFNAWIHKIAYNTFVSSKRAEHITVDYEEATGITANDAADSAFRYQELYTALDKLQPKERMAVLLFYIEGYSIKEIAEIIDAKQDAVKQQLSRGRTHLRNIMGSN